MMMGTRVLTAACMLLFAGQFEGMAATGSGLGAVATAGHVDSSPTFYRHLMSFDKTVGVGGTGCGGDFQECCADGLCADDGLACVRGERCLKCGTSGRPVCDAPSASPCGKGVVAKQGICFKDLSGISGGGGPAPPGSYGGKIPAPPPVQEPPPDAGVGGKSSGGDDDDTDEDDGDDGEDDSEDTPDEPRECGNPFGGCCDDGSCGSDMLECRGNKLCFPCGNAGETACKGGKPCADGLSVFSGYCGDESEAAGDEDSDEDSDSDERTFSSSTAKSKTTVTVKRIPRQANKAAKPKNFSLHFG
eukprot:jgi/Ulvmu1/6385/UM003_0013.1